MKKKIFIAAAVIFSNSAHAQLAMQDSTKLLNDVVITATKFPIKQSFTGKVLTVITKEELEKNTGKNIGEVLNMQTGIIVNGSTNTAGTNQDVYVRGAAAGKTLILIDGIPAYDPSGISGAYDLNFIDAETIERVEILKGSQSTLYGSDAIAGVINLITKKGSNKKISTDILLAAGSYNSFKESLSLNGTVKNTKYNIQYSGMQSKGFSSAYDEDGNKNFDKDGFERNNFSANVQQKITEAFLLKFTSQYSHYKTDLDAEPFADDADYTYTTKNMLAGIGAEYKIGKSTVHVNYNYNSVHRNYLDDSASVGGFAKFSKGSYNGKAHFAELYSNFSFGKHAELLTGIEYRKQITDQEYLSISTYGPFKTALGDSASVQQTAAYTSLLLKDLSGFSLDMGVRYNHFSKYGNAVTFSFSPAYLINEKIKLFASAGTGFKAPSLYQLYSEYKNIHDDLKPEKSINIEGGIQYSKETIMLRAVYFLRDIKNNIVFYSEGAPDFRSYYINADKQKDKGLELEAVCQFDKIKLTANYTNLDGHIETKAGNKDTSFFNLYRRPQQVINLNVGIDICKNWLLNVSVQSIGKRFEPKYNSAPVEMPSYSVWNLYTSYKRKNFKLFADLKNITDEKYFEVEGYNSKRFNVMAGIIMRL